MREGFGPPFFVVYPANITVPNSRIKFPCGVVRIRFTSLKVSELNCCHFDLWIAVCMYEI